MIYVIKHGKLKKDISKNSNDLIRVHKLDQLSDPEQLDKEVRKGNHVYCWISPKLETIGRRHIYWSLSPIDAKENYIHSLNEI